MTVIISDGDDANDGDDGGDDDDGDDDSDGDGDDDEYEHRSVGLQSHHVCSGLTLRYSLRRDHSKAVIGATGFTEANDNAYLHAVDSSL